MIDGGYTDSGNALVEHIKKYYSTEYIDLIISTHPDADHAAGLAVVLEEMEVGALWMHQPTFRGTPEPKLDLLSFLAKAFEPVREAVRLIAERWDFETLTDDGETSAENNSSAIVLIRGAADHWMLFTGDAGIPALTHAADQLQFAGFDFKQLGFVQVPHHGSQRNVGPTILNRLIGPRLAADVNIKTAFVSAATDGAPKHPAKKVTNAFRRRGAPVHATQGITKLHHRDSPDRGWSSSTPLPFYDQVEE